MGESASSAPLGRNEDSAFFIRVVVPLLARWRLLIGLPAIFGVAAAILSLVWPATYTATTTFTPETSGSTSTISRGLASLVGQFGLSASSLGSASSEVFAEVLQSNELLRSALLSTFRDPANASDSTKTLLDLLQVEGHSMEDRLSEGVRRLRRKVTAHVGARTGIVTLNVEARSAVLAADVANRMVALLNQFNLERRQSQSREQRRFVAERLQEAQRELREAETHYQNFLEANRRYSDSPLLTFQANRLEREVQLKQEIVVTLAREFEEARISEVRDTPVLTIIDVAIPPDRRTSPRRTLNVLMALFVGLVGAICLAYAGEFWNQTMRRDPDAYQALMTTWEQARQELAQVTRKGRPSTKPAARF